MTTPRTHISRRGLLQALPATAVAAALPETANAASLHQEGDPERIEQLATELSRALQEYDGGRWFATVHPADQSDAPVAFGHIQDVVDAASDVSPELMEAICAHCVAYNAVGHLGRASDMAALGRAPDADACRKLDEASQQERDLFLAICRYPARNEPERHEKAAYLIGFCEIAEFTSEHVAAILMSMAIALPDLEPSSGIAAIAP